MKDEVNCREASKLLSLAYERRLSPEELELLQHHLAECFMCRNFDSQLRFLHEASSRYRTSD